jgi:DNA polymerase phi
MSFSSISRGAQQLCDALPMLFPTLLSAYKPDEEEIAAAIEEEGEDDDDAELPEPSTVLVSLVLSLLQRPSAFVKAVSQQVVEGFAQEFGQQAVGLLVETIAPSPTLEDQQQQEEEEIQVEGEGEGKKESVSKKKGKKIDSDEVDHQDDEGDSSDSDSDSDDDDDDQIDEKFREELLRALEAGGLAPVMNEDQDSDDDDVEENESEEELLDDEAMMELDDKLADIFRANGGGATKNKKRELSPSFSFSRFITYFLLLSSR